MLATSGNQSISVSVPEEQTRILVAVSGGSDSLALLYLLNSLSRLHISVATVDHGLRVEAREEAKFVNSVASSLGLEHCILAWEPEKRSSQAARLGRYALLCDHAKRIGASAVALGHTMDDQAETIMMRARRNRSDSSTRGLSGIPRVASYGAIKLIRPVLDVRRSALRAYLTDRQVSWIDDPSNNNSDYERVRLRQALSSETGLPPAEHLARLAELATGMRIWMNQRLVRQINDYCTAGAVGSLNYAPPPGTSIVVLVEMIALLVSIVGQSRFRPSNRKIADICQAIGQEKTFRKTIGRCLVDVRSGSAHIQRENRHATVTENATVNSFLDQFRPQADDDIQEALLNLKLSPVV